jgi:hypothetical protein
MIRWRRAAALIGVVAQLVGGRSLGAQKISLSLSGLKADSIPPAPNMLLTALGTAPGVNYTLTLELSTESAFSSPFYVAATSSISATFQLDSLLTQYKPVFFRARLIGPLNDVIDEAIQRHPVEAWLKLDTPPQQSLVILNSRRPLFAWSSPGITLPPGLWQYDLAVINTATGAVMPMPSTNDTSVVFDSLEANTSYSWRVIARGSNNKGSTADTVKSAGTFVITSPTQPTATLFYQNFPDPFGRGQRSGETCFWFDLDRPATVRITIFDIRLRRVRQIVPGPIGNGVLGAGSYGRQDVDAHSGCDPRLTWDGRDDRGRFVSPGIYVAEFVANGKSTTIKMMYKGPP